jgi:GTPase SAR1 family protein
MDNRTENYVNNLNSEENESDNNSEDRSFIIITPSYAPSQTSNNSKASKALKNLNEEKEAKERIVIWNLNEQFGDESEREAADNTEVRQMFIAIEASSVIIRKIFRAGEFQPNGPCRRIVVQFDSENDKQIALSNAKKLKTIPKWKTVSLAPFLTPQQRNEKMEKRSLADEPSSAFPQKLIDPEKEAMAKELAALKEKFMQQNLKDDESLVSQRVSRDPTKLRAEQYSGASSNASSRYDLNDSSSYQSNQAVPNNSNPREMHQIYQSNTHFVDDDENVKKEIVIFNLAEFVQNNSDPDYADKYTVQQILSAIGVSLNITLIKRLGEYTLKCQTKPRRIVVQFHLEQDQRHALENAQHLRHFPQWQHLSIKPYQPRNRSPRGGPQMQQLQYQPNVFPQYPYPMPPMHSPGYIPFMNHTRYDVNTPMNTSVNRRYGEESSPSSSKKPTKSSKFKKASSDEEEDEEEQEEDKSYKNELFNYQNQRAIATKKVLNILVLGETGVGKSTWINGIANYMTFKTLDEAMEAPQPVCLISSKFTFDEREVILKSSNDNKDENEVLGDGKSATQEPKTYQFQTATCIVNIIDTPGIGDTRGIEQDKENTRKILNAIGQYKELHAICFLFKANESKLTVNFRFCISELLLQLHKDAVNNIVFFFTNARTSFYKPGDTHGPLTQFLSELKAQRNLDIPFNSENTCCLDNEAFKLVAAHANGVRFPEIHFKKFESSWKHSAAETHRFIQIAANKPPHMVSQTLSVNKARTVILNLAKPLATVNEMIESNIKVFDTRKRELNNTSNDLKELEKKLKITHIGIEVRPLSYPKTVCAAPKCTELQILPNTEQHRTVYNQICHDHCYLTGVDVEKTPEPHLVGCAAMRGQYCMYCQCHWNTHCHIRFDQIKVTMEVEDQNMKNLIKEKADASMVKQTAIKDCENTITELKAEQQKIIQTSLRFGGFLQANAILPYNDAFEKYVDQTINEEEKCVQIGGDRSKLDGLKKLLAHYQQEKGMLIEAEKNSDTNSKNTITPDEIEVLKAELFRLKNSGKTLKDLFQATEEGLEKHNAHITVKYTPPVVQQNQGRNQRNEKSSKTTPIRKNKKRNH